MRVALLQRWGKKKTEQEMVERNGEKIVWDVVILGDGTRADVVEPQSFGSAGGTATVDHLLKRPSSFMSTSGDYEAFTPSTGTNSKVGRKLHRSH
jgi:hypothetical protein